ncbi:DUF805 domain-containing protein [Staphylococcus sp. GSSP0090]|nr:DUF805 domain-containing protein [Staphylococcus sp. GSSP0090]
MERKVGFVQALKLFWKNYVNFKGRSRRSEYWFMALWNIIFMIPSFILYIVGLIMTVSGAASNSEGLVAIGVLLIFLALGYSLLYGLATLIPSWAILIRRFHDTGRTMLLPIIYLVIVVLSYPILITINVRDPEYSNPINLILFIIIFLVYMALGIYMLVICCLDSERKTNQYGSSHKYGNHIQTSNHGYHAYETHDVAKNEETKVNDKHVDSNASTYGEQNNAIDNKSTHKDDDFKY